MNIYAVLISDDDKFITHIVKSKTPLKAKEIVNNTYYDFYDKYERISKIDKMYVIKISRDDEGILMIFDGCPHEWDTEFIEHNNEILSV